MKEINQGYIAGCVAEGRTLVWVEMTIGGRYLDMIHENLFPFHPEEAMTKLNRYVSGAFSDDCVTFWLVEVLTRDVVVILDRFGGLITTDLEQYDRLPEQVQP